MRNIYFKILLSFLAVLLLNFVLATIFIARFTTRDFDQNLHNQLQANAHVVAALAAEIGLEPERQHDLQAIIEQTGRRTGMRLTVIRLDGDVAADSEQDPATMDNHAGRPEVIAALTGGDGMGMARRYSDTLGSDMAYAAILVRRDGEPLGVVRVAMPESVIREALYASVYRSALYGALIAMAIATVLSVFMARAYARPIELIKNAALKIAKGDFQYRLQLQRKDELSQVAETLNELSETLGRSFKTLHDEQARLQAMLGGISEQMAFIGADGVIYMANASFCRLFGFEANRIAGKSADVVIADAGVLKFIRDTLEDRSPRNFEWNAPKPEDGTVRHFRLSASPVTTAGGRFRGAIILFHDITHQREMEAMRREFADNASHELKTPLSSIMAVVETLIDNDPVDPAQRAKFYNTIQSNTTRLNRLINDLLDLSEIEQKKISLERAPADLCGLVREVISDFLPALDAKNHRIQFDLPQDAVALTVDRKNLAKAISNLVDNAIRYTDDGGAITVRLTPMPQAVRIDVQDTGIGIPARDLDRIFERFYRVDKARSIKTGGTGLGLSIAKHIVEAHNGRLSVQSAPGEGSTFTIILPATSP